MPPHKYTEERKDDRKTKYEFDAPKTKDFTRKKYQKQKKAIEKTLAEHTDAETNKEVHKTKKERTQQIEAAGPRETFYSQLLTKNRSKRQTQQDRETENEVPDTSIDDMWFEKKEAENSEHAETNKEGSNKSSKEDKSTQNTKKNKSIDTDMSVLSPSLYDSEEEKCTDTEILSRLKIVSTPPIKRAKKEAISIEFAPEDIQALSLSHTETTEKDKSNM